MKVCNPADFAGKVLLGIGAHPDDMDFTSSGTIASMVEAGATAYYLILTDGGKGTSDPSLSPSVLTELRRKEQRLACQALGIKEAFFLDYEDGCLHVTMELKRDIAKYIRHLKPDAVFVFDPTMVYSTRRNFINHPDHRAVGQAALDAVFPLARDHLSLPELYEQGYHQHKTKTVFLVNFNEANCYYDISKTIHKKMHALVAHASQIADMAGTEAYIKEFASDVGKECGVRYAENFVRINLSD